MIKKKDMTNLALITHVNLDDLRNITKTSCQVYDDLIHLIFLKKEMKHQNDWFFRMM